MDGEEALTKVGIGSAIVITGFFVGAFFYYLVKVILARFLGPEAYGVFVQGMGIAQAAAMISLLGLSMSIPRFMSFYTGSEDEQLTGSIVSTSLYLIIPSSLLVSAIIFYLSGWISVSVFDEPALEEPLKLFSLAITPLVLFKLAKSLLRGMQDAKHKIYMDDFIWSGGVLLLVASFISAGYGVTGAVYAYIIATSIAVVAGYYFCRKVSEGRLFSNPDFPVRRLISFSWPLFVISILLIVNRWVDVLMLGWLIDSSQAGIYDVSYAIAGIMGFMLSSLSYMFMPVVSELYGKRDMSGILEVYSTSTRWIFTLTLPLLAGMLIFPEEIIHLLFGSSYVEGSVALAVLSIGFFYNAVKGPAGMILLSTGKTRLQMLGIGVITTFTVLLNLLLIPVYGIMGAAISTTIGFFLGDTLLLIFARREVGGLPYNRKYLKAIPAIMLSSGVVYGLKVFLAPSPLESAFLGAFLTVLYAGLLYVSGGLHARDREVLRRSTGSISDSWRDAY